MSLAFSFTPSKFLLLALFQSSDLIFINGCYIPVCMCVCHYVYTKCICITCLVCALLILCMLLRLTIQYRITRLCSSLDKPIDSTLSIPYLLLFLSVVLTPLTSTYLLVSITFVLYTILNKSLFF